MTRHKARKGFNLIEAAIVLAVVGAVIGGIWVAAATVSYNYQKQQFLQGFLTIQRLADKYLSQSLPCTTDLMYPGMGGWFLKNESPAVYKLLMPPEWRKINFSKFIRFNLSGLHTQISCDNETRYYGVALYFASSSICHETFNYLRARNVNVGRLGHSDKTGTNNCNNGRGEFNIAFTISQR